jgi:hypothetical protein
MLFISVIISTWAKLLLPYRFAFVSNFACLRA